MSSNSPSSIDRVLNFTGKLVRLRPFEPREIDEILRLINDPDVRRYLSQTMALPITRNDEEKWLSKRTAFDPDYSFAIERLEDKQLLGSTGFMATDWKNRHSKLGIFLGSEFTGKGYGSDSFRLLINFGFWEMNLRKLKLDVHSYNTRAISLYEKLGFQIEGRLKQEIFRDGEYHDTIQMAIFRDEWSRE